MTRADWNELCQLVLADALAQGHVGRIEIAQRAVNGDSLMRLAIVIGAHEAGDPAELLEALRADVASRRPS